MKTLNLAVVCPVTGLPQNTEETRQAVWTNVTALLQPGLGTQFFSFYPASFAWGMPLNAPFGVLLGRDDPERFIQTLLTASEVQSKAIRFHVEGMLEGIDPETTCTVGDATICPVYLDGTDKALAAHSIWNLGLAAGELLPDCGVYYLEQGHAIADEKTRKAVASRLADYAVCVVTLEVEEGAA